jgi:uncharacterized protein YidB (DUF937 family)
MGAGLGSLIEGLQRAGFGEQANSWVGRGQNLPIPGGVLRDLLGTGGLASIAHAAGVGEDEAADGLSQLLPEVVDRLTPEGRLPQGAGELNAGLEQLLRRLGG